MDCKIYLSDGQTAVVPNVKNIHAVPVSGTAQMDVVVYGLDDENKHPIAAFYNVMGYELIGRR